MSGKNSFLKNKNSVVGKINPKNSVVKSSDSNSFMTMTKKKSTQ